MCSERGMDLLDCTEQSQKKKSTSDYDNIVKRITTGVGLQRCRITTGVGLHRCGITQVWDQTGVGLQQVLDYTSIGLHRCRIRQVSDYTGAGLNRSYCNDVYIISISSVSLRGMQNMPAYSIYPVNSMVHHKNINIFNTEQIWIEP